MRSSRRPAHLLALAAVAALASPALGASIPERYAARLHAGGLDPADPPLRTRPPERAYKHMQRTGLRQSNEQRPARQKKRHARLTPSLLYDSCVLLV